MEILIALVHFMLNIIKKHSKWCFSWEGGVSILRKSQGISLLETLVSLSILFFIISLVLPQLYLLSIERENLKLENFAMKTLNEQLFEHSIEKNAGSNEVSMLLGIPFNIEVINTKNELDQQIYEGCIRWENLKKRERIKCGSVY